jgi:hypothetical protein
MLYAAPLRIGNREQYAGVVALFQDACGGSHRQDAGLLDVVYHLHRLTDPSVCYPLYPCGFHVRLPRKSSACIQFIRHANLRRCSSPRLTEDAKVDNEWGPWDRRHSEAVERRTQERVLYWSEMEADLTAK